VLPIPQPIGNLAVHPLRLSQLIAWISAALERPGRATVFYANIHAVNLAEHDTAFLAAYATADVTFCDGQGVRLGAALLGRPLPERFTPPDWIDQLMAVCAARGQRVFLLGSQPGVADEAAARLRARHRGLQIAAHHGYILASSQEEAAALEAIHAYAPALLLVGMGMPAQERWIANRRAELNVPVVMSVGALFDYLAGHVSRGPRWLTDNGFEWLCRLWYEPRRLWRRYLLGNPTFMLLIVRQMVIERRKLAQTTPDR
jgi:N-acetylglucosaminyldiphosphoundecaprenol N-acetyl-beta-D-mannosaminyltransferase